MGLLEKDGSFNHLPTVAKKVFDVTGAGDTVIEVFITRYPIATKRTLRALLMANDLVASDPKLAAKLIVQAGAGKPAEQEFLTHAFSEIPYAKWRDYNPEDTIRFYALRLKELGLIKYSPAEIIAMNTDWRFLQELKAELGHDLVRETAGRGPERSRDVLG